MSEMFDSDELVDSLPDKDGDQLIKDLWSAIENGDFNPENNDHNKKFFAMRERVRKYYAKS